MRSSAMVLAAIALASVTAFSPQALQAQTEPPTATFPPSSPSSVSHSDRVAVFVQLSEPSLIETYLAAEARGQSEAQITRNNQSRLASLNRDQARLATQLSRFGAQELYRVQRTLNGIGVYVDAQHLDAIRALPGVTQVMPIPTSFLNHTTSVPLIGAPNLWGGNGLNIAGEGIKIGIIDSGVDYQHTMFGGSGTGYAENDTTIITDTIGGQAFFPNSKVVGGYDFAGDAYTGRNQPQPDPDPQDCAAGHGTHVAGSAAGYGVNADGSTYTGAYSAATDFSGMRIGPGVAPKAQIYALRIFGCEGTTRLVVPAIEWSTDPNQDGDFSDRLDVINLSLGGDVGSIYNSTVSLPNEPLRSG